VLDAHTEIHQTEVMPYIADNTRTFEHTRNTLSGSGSHQQSGMIPIDSHNLFATQDKTPLGTVYSGLFQHTEPPHRAGLLPIQ